MERTYQICKKCIMDTSDPRITFDENGICNHCNSYEESIKKYVLKGEKGKEKIRQIVSEIKKSSKGRKYDCIVGISGGVDSSYVIYIAKKIGLNPLAVHLDNGWNSKTATRNINKQLKKLDVDLYTHVINWEEFKDMQLAYLKASVVDIEALTDHAIKAILFKVASKRGIKYIITGTNIVTEGVLPRAWRHNKDDYVNIRAIHKKFGKVKLQTYPLITLSERAYYQLIKGIKTVEILNYVPYNKEKVKKVISEKLGWEDYGRKHGESTFTRFYQEYILPKKFKFDKRRAHFSALICAEQISREEALKEIEKEPYEVEELRRDKEYVSKKFGLSEEEFEAIMNLPVKSHYDYKSGEKFFMFARSIYLGLARKQKN